LPSGAGSLLPSAFQVLEKSSSSIADIGEPCPTKIIGIKVLFIRKRLRPFEPRCPFDAFSFFALHNEAMKKLFVYYSLSGNGEALAKLFSGTGLYVAQTRNRQADREDELLQDGSLWRQSHLP
jgi:hypothetical protein